MDEKQKYSKQDLFQRGPFACSYSQQGTKDSTHVFTKETQINEYIRVVGDLHNIRKRCQQKILGNQKLVWVPQFSEEMSLQILQFNIQSFSLMAHYANYKMKISILMTYIGYEKMSEHIFAQGTFGSIYRVKIDEKQYALKGTNVLMEEGKINMKLVYKEYFLSSLASIIQVAPKMEAIMGYDIVTFQNRAFFALQLCEPALDQQDGSQVFSQMIQNLGLIHSIGFVHLDIKSANIVYSFLLKKYVFIDFGFSKIIKQPLGTKVYSNFAGTIEFCSEEMKRAYWLSKEVPVDLYFNDFVCLKKTEKSFHFRQRNQSDLAMQERFSTQTLASFDYLLSALKICQLKFLIFTQNIQLLIIHVHSTLLLSKTNHILLSDEYLTLGLRESFEVKKLVTYLKEIIIKCIIFSPFDEYISKALSKSERAVLTPHILTIEYILKLPTEKFMNVLTQIDFVHRLFFIFSPTSKIFGQNKTIKMINQINDLRRIIVNKITQCLRIQRKGEILFYQKVRHTTVYFYTELKALKKTEVLISLRLMFILMGDYQFLHHLELQICILTADKTMRLLHAVQFTLFSLQRDPLKKDNYLLFQKYFPLSDSRGQIQIDFQKFLHQLLMIKIFMQVSKQASLLFKKSLQKWKNTFPEYEEQLINIQVLYWSLTKVKYSEKEKKLTLLQYIYYNSYFPELPFEFRSTIDFFALRLQVHYSSFNPIESVSKFKYESSLLFKVLKEINQQQAQFFTVKDNIFFYYDYQLALAVLKLYSEHLRSFSSNNETLAFNSFFVLDWLLNIFQGNQSYCSYRHQSQKNQNLNAMLTIIQQCYLDLKCKSQRFQGESWYILITNTYDCLFLIFKKDYRGMPLKLENMKVFLESSQPCENISALKVLINMVYYIYQQSFGLDSKVPNQVYIKVQSMLIQIHRGYTQNYLTQLFEKTALLYLLIKIYIKNKQESGCITLIRFVIQKTNQRYYNLNPNTINNFCDGVRLSTCVQALKQLMDQPVGFLGIESVYFQYCFVYKIINQAHSFPKQSCLNQEKNIIEDDYICLIPWIRCELMRIGVGISQDYCIFRQQVAVGLYRCHRLTLGYKSRRKKIICLRREGQFKEQRANLAKKFPFPETANQKITQKINRIYKNQQCIAPKL